MVFLRVSAGFPSPAEVYVEKHLSLDDLLVQSKVSTYFVYAKGHSMKDAGIGDGDLLIVDRALEAFDKSIVVAMLDGDFTIKRLHLRENEVILLPENPAYPPIHVTKEMSFEIWGVVKHVIKSF